MLPVTDATQLATRPPVIHLEGRLPVLEAPAAKALGLNDGQVVRPLVEVTDGQVRLMLQGHAIDVPPSLRQLAGERPWWRVRADARGQVTLVPLAGQPEPGGPQGPAPAGAEGVTVQAGRLEQLALRPPSTQALAALMQPGALAALWQAAPQAEVAGWVDQLVRQFPSTRQLSPELVRRLLRTGGWTQEAALAAGRHDGPSTKSLLQAILQAWTQAPAATRERVQQAVDDIESQQLRVAIDQQAGREVGLAMVIPFADAEPVEVRWTRTGEGEGREEGAGKRDGRRPWRVDLHTRSSAFGEIWLRTRITGEDVDLSLWAERADFAAQARAAGPGLAAWLNESGLRLCGLRVAQGRPPAVDDTSPTPPGEPGRLVDVKA